MNTCVRYPGIAEIRYLPIASVQSDLEMAAEANVKVAMAVTAYEVSFVGEPELSESATNESGFNTSTATLSFSAAYDTIPQGRLCMLVQDVEGQWYLIGNHERAVQIERNKTTGTTGTSKGVSFTISFTSSHPVIPVNLALI